MSSSSSPSIRTGDSVVDHRSYYANDSKKCVSSTSCKSTTDSHEHYRKHDPPWHDSNSVKPLTSEEDEKRSVSVELYLQEAQNHSVPYTVACPCCDETSVSAAELEMHLCDSHADVKETILSCRSCNFRFVDSRPSYYFAKFYCIFYFNYFVSVFVYCSVS